MAIRVMLNSFITSQKYSVAREMKKKFRKYLAYKRDNNEILLVLLKTMWRSQQEYERAKDVASAIISVNRGEFEASVRSFFRYYEHRNIIARSLTRPMSL
jgi:DNA replication licensing factor MCM2